MELGRRLPVGRVLVVAALACGWAASARAGEVSPELAAAIAGIGPHEEVSILVELDSARVALDPEGGTRAERLGRLVRDLRAAAEIAERPARRALAARQATRVVSLWAIGDLAATVPAAAVADLAALPGVGRVRLDAFVTLPSEPAAAKRATAAWNLEMVGAPELWARGISGDGAVVAVLDTGVDALHQDLAPRWRGGAGGWFDPYGQHSEPHDADGHGTQVAGLVLGGDATGAPIGVAPGARWIAARVYDDVGHAAYSAIHQSFQWLLDPDDDPSTDDAPHVVVGPWGFVDQVGQCVDEFARDIAILRAAGIAAVFSAGNSGPAPMTSVSPSDNAGAFSVGGVNDAAAVMSASSRGPSACDGGIFPSVVAPGESVLTADKTFGGVFPAAAITVSGTSFAAPHAAGALALLRDAHPEATLARLEAALRAGAVDLGAAGPDNDAGWGLLDVVAAEAALAGLLDGPGTVTTYTDEGAFLAAVADRDTVLESFEDDAAWGGARSPATLPSVASQGIAWASNHSQNNITTGSGPARTGSWGLYSLPHGDQSLTDPNAFITDGFTGAGATPLTAVGGWFVGLHGSRVALVLDGDEAGAIELGPVDNQHAFYGVTVSGSFTSFEFRETEGTVEDQKYIFVDDVTIAVVGGAANRPPDGAIVQPNGDVTIVPGGSVFFEGTASDPDGDPVTVLWDFGDGRSSTDPVPGDVIYPQAGVFTVTFTATDDSGLSDPTPPSRMVTVGEPPPPMDGVVAGVANLPGAQGSDWHSDLFLHNTSAAEISVELSFSADGSPAGSPGLVAIVAPGETRVLEDVVAAVFGVQGSGAVHWRVADGDPDAVVVSANTFNRVDQIRRYGQQIAGVRWSEVAAAGTPQTVPALAGRYRTNLGLATDGDCTGVRVRGYDRTGELVAQRSLAVQPWSWTQLNALFRRMFPDLLPDPDTTPLAESIHRFEVTGIDGRVVTYTSIVDNATNDGSYMLGQRAVDDAPQWLPGAAVIRGANASDWRSDVVLMSTSDAPEAASIAFLPAGQDNGGVPDQRAVPLAVGESVVLDNILAGLFGYTPPAVGSLRVAMPAAAPLVWMRTYTEEPANGGGTVTYGQAILPRGPSQVVPAGGSAVVSGFSHDAAARANLILQNTRTANDGTLLASQVRVELLGSDGHPIHQQVYRLLPGEYRQHNRFVDDFGTGPVQHVSLVVTVVDQPGTGETGGVDAMVSEVNGNTLDGTNDSRLIRAEPVR